MSMLARVSDERRGDVLIATVEGEIDASNVHELGEQLRALVPHDGRSLVIDLSATGYVDSAGLNLIFALGTELAGRRQQLRVVVPDDSPISRTIEITGLDRAVPVDTTLESALERARTSLYDQPDPPGPDSSAG